MYLGCQAGKMLHFTNEVVAAFVAKGAYNVINGGSKTQKHANSKIINF